MGSREQVLWLHRPLPRRFTACVASTARDPVARYDADDDVLSSGV